MSKTSPVATILALASISSATLMPLNANAAPATSGRETINGVAYYYEVRGKGEPLLLLHGGLGSIDMFGPVLLRMALQHPERVRRLALVSTPFSDDGFYPGIKAQQLTLNAASAPAMKDTPMFKSYAAVAPKVEDFPRLLDTLGNYMRQKYDWSAEVPGLKMPVMLVYGDSDMFSPEHIVKFYQLLGGGLQDAGWQRETMAQNRLAILPDLTHYDIFTSPRLATTVLPFLDGKSDARSWAEQVKGTK
jgi:pimeloyl-ACP methyl ester carboxylesterase